MRFYIICLLFLTSLSANGQLKLSIGNAEVAPEDPLCLDVTVDGFTQMASAQFRITWDTDLLQLDSTTNVSVRSSTGAVIGDQTDEIRFGWIAEDLFNGLTLEDGELLFTACFTALAAGEAIVAVDENMNGIENPLVPEFANLINGLIEDITYESGSVSINEVVDEVGCALALSFNQSGLECHDEENGRLEAVVEGGNGPLNYNWNTSDTSSVIENLSAGEYSLTISDEMGCTVSEEVTLQAPEQLAISIEESANFDCSTSIQVGVSGGTTPYQYQLGEMPFQDMLVFSELSAGDYMLTVRDDKGCIEEVTFVINETLLIGDSCDDGDEETMNDMINDSCMCEGIAIVDNTGGNTGEMDGSEGTDDSEGMEETNTGEGETGNTDMEEENMEETTGNTGTTTPPTANCFTETVTVQQAICRGQSYLGYQETGTYTDTLKTINGCDSIRTLALSVSDRIRTQVDTTICEGEMVAGQTEKGSYIDVFTSVAGCDSIRILNLFVTPAGDAACSTTSVIDLSKNNTFQVGPNPVEEVLLVTAKQTVASSSKLSIYSIYGQLMNTHSLTNQRASYPMGHLAKGTYLIVIESGGKRYLQKLVKL